MFFWLVVLLGIEFVFRVALEIREARLFSRKNRFALFRVIPFINDFVPFPENRDQTEISNPFVKFHEEVHEKLHHSMTRLLLKGVFFFLSILGIFYVIGQLRMSLVEVVILFHLALFFLQIPYHYYIWQQEFEADAYAAKKTSITQAKKQFRLLANQEIPYSTFFALLYREHPPAALRLKKVISKFS
ncbi:MAG TPA: M48 family metalloprotease [Fibrobacteraceae bacterium]|jgi:ABC-type multidrug transport system fused ATPase/permease subunit|nr:M48 family metalloprotease [Fibrobacter sp.]HPW94645.1 M48 family metalloprotease [Fibrobacteraceae bacterium]